MIVTLRGVFVGWTEDDLFIIDCGGVGYGVFGCDPEFDEFEVDDEVAIFVYQVQHENKAPELYGFAKALSRRWFRLLLGVSGIGPSLAARLIICHGSDGLIAHIQDGNASALVVPKVPLAKTERIVKKLAAYARK